MIKNGACGLSSINLSEYVLNKFTDKAEFDYASLEKDIKYIVIAMDDVIEENSKNHALHEQRDVSLKYRNIGIGIMGLHDCLIKLGIVYGSDKAIKFTDKIMQSIFRYAIFASAELGKERGNFPGYNDKVWDANILKYVLYPEEIDKLRKQGTLRNCSLLSIAPTGSIGTMLNVSTGCEPWFALHYTRNTKSLNGEKEESYEVWAPIAEEALKHNCDKTILNTSNDISWKEHIDMQAACQHSCDTAISKTINMPRTTTVEDIKQLYMYAWEKGLKGCTIFVDGSRDPILSNDTNKKDNLDPINNPSELKRGDIIKVNNNCIGLKRTLTTGCGSLHCTAYFDKNTGNLLETYLSKGSQGGCQNFMVGLSRMVSLASRGGINIYDIVDQLKSCGTCPSYAVRRATKKDTSIGSCCPVAVGNALLDMHKEMITMLQNNTFNNNNVEAAIVVHKCEENNNIYSECPECHEKTLVHDGGCTQCLSCGYSKCS